MGAALIRKCWDVQEEKWGGNDNYDYESTNNNSHSDCYYDNQYKYNFITQRKSI